MRSQNLKRALTKINDIHIFYRDTVSGARSMLCLHGRWGRGETWVDLIRRYRDRFRVIAPDQRGHGLSDKPEGPYTAEAFAGDAHSLIRHLDCAPALVVGHSMGGRVAGYLAALYPESVRALAILDETAEGPESRIGADISVDSDPCDDGLTKSWRVSYPTYDGALEDLSRRFERQTNVQYFLDSLTETVEGYELMFSRRAMASIGRSYESWYHLLPKIQCPVLFVRAAESWCLPEGVAARMRTLIRNCTYFEVANSDHMVYADNPDQFYSVFDDFIGSL